MTKLTLASLLLTSLTAPVLSAAETTNTEPPVIETVTTEITTPPVSNELELAQADSIAQEDVPALANTEQTITLTSSATDSATPELSPAELIVQAIANDPDNAQAIIAQAFAAMNSVEEMEILLSDILASSGDDPILVQSVASAMIESGVSSDTVVALAVAQGIDATLVSEATAAGPDTANGLSQAEIATARAAEVAEAIAAGISPRKPGNGGNGGISKNV